MRVVIYMVLIVFEIIKEVYNYYSFLQLVSKNWEKYRYEVLSRFFFTPGPLIFIKKSPSSEFFEIFISYKNNDFEAAV